jgi:hypothetical protein
VRREREHETSASLRDIIKHTGIPKHSSLKPDINVYVAKDFNGYKINNSFHMKHLGNAENAKFHPNP